MVVSIPVAVGDEVDEGGVVAVVEAMKMETSLTAPFHGRVRAVLAGTNVHVAAQAPLVALEPLDGGPPPAAGERISFAPAAPTRPAALNERLQRLAWLVLGYDVDAREAERIVGGFDDDPELIAGEHRLLADVRRRARAVAPAPRRGRPGRPRGCAARRSTSMPGWARSTPRRPGCPKRSWRNCAPRSLTMGSPASTARRRWRRRAIASTSPRSAPPTARAAIVSILERRLDQVAAPAGAAGEDFREALDHLILTMEGRDPVVADLAREVRYHVLRRAGRSSRAREAVYTEMRGARRRARAVIRSGPTATSASRRSSTARSLSRRSSARACARPQPQVPARPRRGDGAPLLPGALTRGLRAARPSAATSC